MSQEVIIIPNADGVPTVTEKNLGDNVADYAAQLQVDKQVRESLQINDGTAPPVPPGLTEGQLQRLQQHPVYRARTPEGEAFRAAIANGYANVGKPVARPGEVQDRPTEQVEAATDEEVTAADSNQALAGLALDEAEAQEWNEGVQDIESAFGEGSWDLLVNASVDADGELADETVEQLAEAGYDYEAMKADALYVGGASLAQMAAAEGFTAEGLLAFADSLNPVDSKALARALLRGESETVRGAMRSFKARAGQ